MDPAVVPDELQRRVDGIDHRAAYVQIHFALDGLPEFTGQYEIVNEGTLRANMGVFSTPEQMQRDFEGCLRGEVPQTAVVRLPDPERARPVLAPPGKHAASAYAFYFPIVGTREEQNRLGDEMADRVVARIAQMAPNFPDIIERTLVYPSYTYELMFGATDGDFCHGLLQPEIMGPFRPGPHGLARPADPGRRPVPVEHRVPRRSRASRSSPATTGLRRHRFVPLLSPSRPIALGEAPTG